MLSKNKMSIIGKADIVTYAKKNGIVVSADDSKKELVRKVLEQQKLDVSDEGVMKYARNIKFGGRIESGYKGAVQFLQAIYPSLEYEDARTRMRAIHKTVGGV